MRNSIAKKATAACIAMLVLTMLLVGYGVRVSARVQAANEHIHLFSSMLRQQDEEDRMQRQLRLALGDITRQAEQGRPVSAVSLGELTASLRRFSALSASSSRERQSGVPPQIRRSQVTTYAATQGFVHSGERLLVVSQREPAAIKKEMPRFLDALKRLEGERTDLRQKLGQRIGLIADDTIAFNRRSALWLSAGGAAAILILFALALWLRLRVVVPLVAIARRLRQLADDDIAIEAVPGGGRDDEIGELARGLSEYRDAVAQRTAAQRKVDFLAHHDVLTGLPNRLLFENRLAHELLRCRRSGEQVALFAIDMDGFKEINDRHGHAGGDNALRHAARLLRECVRADDLVARIGGDEFAIVQVAGPQPAAAESLLARLSDATAATIQHEMPIRMSIGVAISGTGQDAESLYDSADLALYRAKSDGRNTARFFDIEMQEEVRLRRRLARDLETAIDGGELYVVFQPIATVTRRTVGFEALLRWAHPELGEIAPSTFIAIAEATGQIARIGKWMAQQAMHVAAQWPDTIDLSLNLSPLEFREAGLAGELLALAAHHGVAPVRLKFEVTESVTLLGHNRDAVLATLRELQGAGARIAMDDFGTGHSSLSNLKDFEFDQLKIDRSFVAAMLSHRPSASIVKATIGLGRSLGLSIVAEGVETREQLDQLRAWGCELVQGYYLGRPARWGEDAATLSARDGTVVTV
ncbi:EAL domain-containing protein [Sphingomonas sp. CFBP 13720]|uniref:EAL domain-containing protein n=1 Tax=Sphingomonas sp. CFBP 13720 TaxID=2775302 RepID=UPI0017833AA5|nr:EAL domain-containing protein [Sphingomonas sp. CFBP 13720]